MLGDAIQGARRPGTIAVPAQVKRVHVVALAEFLGHPVPIARVVERTVHQNQGRLAVLAVIPELQLEAVGIEEVGDGFHGRSSTNWMNEPAQKIHGIGLVRQLWPGGQAGTGPAMKHFRPCAVEEGRPLPVDA